MKFLQRFSGFGHIFKKERLAGRLGILAASVLLGLLMFVVGFLISFPEQVLQSRLQYELNRNLPADISLGSTGFSFPLGITAEDVRIKPRVPNAPLLSFDSVSIAPGLGTLFGVPEAHFAASSGPGRIFGSMNSAGELVVDIENYSLDEAIPDLSTLRLSTDIRSAHIETDMTPQTDSQTTINVQAGDLNLSGLSSLGFSADRLNLGNLDLRIGGSGRNLTIEKGSLQGGKIMAEATGQIVTSRSLQASRINIVLQLKTAEDLDPSIGSILELAGPANPDGSRQIKLRGSLVRPNVY